MPTAAPGMPADPPPTHPFSAARDPRAVGATEGRSGRSGRRNRPRRRGPGLLARAALVLVAVVAVVGGALAAVWMGASTNTAGEVDFSRPLAIPPLADATVDANGRRVFDLRLQTGNTDFGRGRATPTWGINGSHLGPTLRAAHGERVAVNVTNDIGEATSLHWHGMRLPAEMDGGPHQTIGPRATWSPTWTVSQPAATLWYHPHLHGSTARHVYRGLAGMFIIDDPASDLDLPRDYGVDDIPAIVQDKSFTGDAQFDDRNPMFSPTGLLGDTVLVNGTVGAYHDVTTEKVRLRLLNASNARVYTFGLVGPDDRRRSFALIGTDGGLLPSPRESDRVQLSPGERAEIVVSMTPGQDLVLRSHPTDLGTDFWNQHFSGGDDTLDVMQLRAADTLKPSPDVPDRLAPAPHLREAEAATTRTFRLGGTNINRLDMDMDRIDQVVTIGDTEVWEVSNAAGTPHNFHVHGVQFRVLDIDRAAPPSALGGWKDTVLVRPGTTVRLLMSFTDYADPDFPYMFHCHLLRHEDQGMMGQFVVVHRGQEPASRGTGESHDH